MDQRQIDEDLRARDQRVLVRKARLYDEIAARIEDKETNAILSKDDSKPMSYQYQFFVGYLAALEELEEIITENPPENE